MKFFTTAAPPPHRVPIGPLSGFTSRIARGIALSCMAALLILLVGPVEAAVRDQCEWSDRGRNPFMLDVPSAVDVYTHIPKATRDRLKARMRARDYEDFAEIRRDKIIGRSGAEYGDLRFMHFGYGEICARLNFESWAPDDIERGLVYCEGDHCIIVPTVCRNVSLITRTKAPPPPMALQIPPLSSPGDLQAELEPGEISWSGDDSQRGRLSLTTLLGDPLPPALVPPIQVEIPPTAEETPWEPMPTVWPFRWLIPTFWPLPEAFPTPLATPGPGGQIPPVFALIPPSDGRMRIAPTPFGSPSAPVAPVPEPGTWLLMALGLVLVTSWARKHKSA